MVNRRLAAISWAVIAWLDRPPVEPSPCYDCGRDTTPCHGGRRCGGRRPWCRHEGRWELYMVHDDLWTRALRADLNDLVFLCIKCLESRLGRRLTPDDFSDRSVNELSSWDTDRLLDRKINW